MVDEVGWIVISGWVVRRHVKRGERGLVERAVRIRHRVLVRHRGGVRRAESGGEEKDHEGGHGG